MPYRVKSNGGIVGSLERIAASGGEKEAVASDEGTATYGELNGAADTLARSLIAGGVGENRPVALLVRSSLSRIAAFLGVMKAGGLYLPVDMSITEPQLRRILEMYQEIGLDVYLEEVTPEECGGCTICYAAGDEPITRIYTRAKPS